MITRQTRANALRMLSADAIEQAQSGHPGMPLGMADIAEVLWNDFLHHNPTNPQWFNRDRFVLSNGHGSMLLYALLHLTGYALSIQELQQFRQLSSRTPGHPEVGHTPGVETTTGPLGQGLANAVGMAIAEMQLAACFNRNDIELVDHFTYAFVGDGCLMEGISHESASLAGTLKLGKLIVFYDDNGISIDGKTQNWLTDDAAARFRSYQWHVIDDINGHNSDAISQAIRDAQANRFQPTLIICKTQIGFGAPNIAGHHHCHGSPLGADEVQAMRHQLQWPHPPFFVPEEIYSAWDKREHGAKLETKWQQTWAHYQAKYPNLASTFQRRIRGELPDNWRQVSQKILDKALTVTTPMATRKASLYCLNHMAPMLPELIVGSADLTESNLTRWEAAITLSHDNQEGNYLYYGVREFGMSAIMNGIALHGGCIPVGGTFLVFSDYARNAIRMAALMKQRVIFIFTHDSIALGEDGPTHQPIEHITMLRATPNLALWRPCDLVETVVSWHLALRRKNAPSALLFSRQKLAAMTRSPEAIDGIKHGGYILRDAPEPQLIFIATGSEVHLAIDAYEILHQQGLRVRMVSMPSMDAFLNQTQSYQDHVLPPKIKERVAIEAGSSMSWYRIVGDGGLVIGTDDFGTSAPLDDVMKHFHFTPESIVERVMSHFSDL